MRDGQHILRRGPNLVVAKVRVAAPGGHVDVALTGVFGQHAVPEVRASRPLLRILDGGRTLAAVVVSLTARDAIVMIGGFATMTILMKNSLLENLGQDYVRTAQAKGISRNKVLFKHVLKNAMIPILTGVVVILPLLFMGSLITESFFGIPGLGSYTIDAINRQDFAIVRAMVFLGSVLYIIGLIMTDISYTMVDPRIRLE